MTDEVKSQPTTVELQAKVERLANDVTTAKRAVSECEATFASVVKSGNVDKALEVASQRTTLQATLVKTEAQHKSAVSAVKSAQWAANAEKMASIHDQMRGDKSLTGRFEALEAFGVVRVEITRGESGKLIINSTGPTIKKTRASGGGNGKRGQPLTVDGTEYASASAANQAFYPDSGPLNRASIISKLENDSHEVS